MSEHMCTTLNRIKRMPDQCVEATNFALEILMPENLFIDFVENKSRKLTDVADYFEVTLLCAEDRARQLGYL